MKQDQIGSSTRHGSAKHDGLGGKNKNNGSSLSGMFGGQSMSTDPEDELADLKKRFHLLEGDRKAYFETSQWMIRQNKETVSTYRRENKQLRAELASLQKQENTRHLASHSIKAEIDKLDQKLLDQRKKCDELKHASRKKEETLIQRRDTLAELQREAARANHSDNPATRAIRKLETRLERALMKHNEAQSIRKTYEQIIKRLQEERLGFDNQLAAMERTLRAKEHDYEELLLMSRDAQHAREVTLAELKRFENAIDEEKKARERELAERRMLVKTKVEINDRMEKRAKQRNAMEMNDRLEGGDHSDIKGGRGPHGGPPGHFAMDKRDEEEQEKKITTYEDAFRKIKEATGVSDINEVIQKFLTQEDTHNNLLALKSEAANKIDSLTEEKAALRNRAEEIKYSGSGSVGSRRAVDEFEAYLTEAQAKCDKHKARYERLHKLLINVKAGVSHLGDKLEFVDIDMPQLEMSDETVVEILTQAETKLVKLLDVIKNEYGEAPPSNGGASTMATAASPEAPAEENVMKSLTEGDLPAYNTRIALPVSPKSDDDGGDDITEDDVLDREAMKKHSAAIVDRASKRVRGKRKHRSRDD